MLARWKVPHQRRLDAIELALIVLVAGVCYAGGLIAHAPTLHQTRIVRVNPYAGNGDQTVAGAQLSSQLAGLQCHVFRSRKAVVCRP